ncbi:MAG: cyclophilin-like fold protein [Anaerostipes sp.]|nr:cyclophilin-like fold protein [Anaerostipes sp.]
MKRKISYVLLILMVLGVVGCGRKEEETREHQISEVQNTESEEDQVNAGKMLITIGDTVLTATLENNEAVDALTKLLEDGDLTIHFSQYGGVEQVGSIGSSLPTNDVQTATSPGDIMLYTGDQMVLFYGNHSWEYTRLGKIDHVSASDLENILGNGDITATFSFAE